MGILRFLLSTSVVSAHYNLNIPLLNFIPFAGHGAFSVSAFFIISGFYMALILNTKYRDCKNFLSFYLSRLMRLLPPLLLIYIASALVAYLTRSTTFGFWNYETQKAIFTFNTLSVFWKTIVVLANTTSLFTDLLQFVAFDKNGCVRVYQETLIPGAYLSLFPPGWSLSVEMCFYAMAPFLARTSTQNIVIIFVSSLIIRTFIYFFITGGWASGYVYQHTFMPSELIFFLSGMISYKFFIKINLLRFYSQVGYLFLLALIMIWRQYNNWLFEVELKLALETIILVLFIPVIFKASQYNKYDRIIGDYSYPIYIVHFISYKLAIMLNVTPWLMLMILSSALIYYIEKPLEIYRSKYIIKHTQKTAE